MRWTSRLILCVVVVAAGACAKSTTSKVQTSTPPAASVMPHESVMPKESTMPKKTSEPAMHDDKMAP